MLRVTEANNAVHCSVKAATSVLRSHPFEFEAFHDRETIVGTLDTIVAIMVDSAGPHRLTGEQ